MRIGQNPNKHNKSEIPHPRITAGIVTHYTNDQYHKERIPIVKTCIESILAGSPDEFIIWDNGSTPEFIQMLKEYKPDVFIQSYNVGSATARHGIAEIARAPILYISDDDIFHETGWMQKHLTILETYPNIGTVSGSPQRVNFRWGIKSNLEMAEKNKEINVEIGRLIPQQYEREYCESIGADYASHKKSYDQFKDYLFTYRNLKAWAHGHHMQFMAFTDVIKPLLKPTDILMKEQKSFDLAVDAAGLMRLTTYERTAWHMGNHVV